MRQDDSSDRQTVTPAIVRAFRETHEGRSTDDLLCDDDLNRRFLDRCSQLLLVPLPDCEINWLLLNLRKRGALGRVVTERTTIRCGEYSHASEIAARLLEDKYRATIDRVLCDPALRGEFDRIASGISVSVSVVRLRKAALCLRKNRKLRPELSKILAAHAQVETYDAVVVAENPKIVERRPGIYMIRSNEGYLYVGEAQDLHTRIKSHLDHSDRKELARYFWSHGLNGVSIDFHSFGPHSEARHTSYRRAYEADMIRSRKPRFNIQGV